MIRTPKLLAVFCLLMPVMAVDQTLEEHDPNCVIKTSKGDIVVRLFAGEAPKTLENFVGLARAPRNSPTPTASRR